MSSSAYFIKLYLIGQKLVNEGLLTDWRWIDRIQIVLSESHLLTQKKLILFIVLHLLHFEACFINTLLFFFAFDWFLIFTDSKNT